ncbi:MAG: OB-fold domain-containing protein [Myxococcota bacterium]
MDHPDMLAARPRPAIEAHTAPFWQAARQHQLVLPRCTACDELQFPPEASCRRCGAPDFEWIPASGRATLYTWTLCHPPLLPFFSKHAPWAVAAVELEEGLRMVTRVADVPLDEYEIGMPLVADFEEIDDEHTLVVFRRPG